MLYPTAILSTLGLFVAAGPPAMSVRPIFPSLK